MRYFAVGYDGELYDLCDCGDDAAANESAADLLEDGALLILDELEAEQWYLRLQAYFATEYLEAQ